MTASPALAAVPHSLREHIAFESRPEKKQSNAAEPVRTVRIALAGCGVVGGAFVRLLQRSADDIATRHGIRFEIASVLVRELERTRAAALPRATFTNDIERFLETDADVVVEAICGRETAATIAQATLERGARFVTANKALVAATGAQLQAKAAANGGALDFDAAVGGGAPVVRTVREAAAGTAPAAIRGILNGTSNYVLTELERERAYKDAVAAARERGLAEADLTRDLDGRDTAAKLAILAWLAYGINPDAVQVRRKPLLPDPECLVQHAAALGGRVRLLGECVVTEPGKLAATVEPTVVAPDGPFGRTAHEENYVEIDLGWGAPLTVSGPGAGGDPTAAALLADLLAGTTASAPRPSPSSSSWESSEDPRLHRWLLVARADRLVVPLVGRPVLTREVGATRAAETSVLTTPMTAATLDRTLTFFAHRRIEVLTARVEPSLAEAQQ